ncbi:glutathione S-transferase, N-terminal domain protein [Asticcacaulis biprosthecium C19]|uniref:Glutathione S-transferase, N-terminal domain protein n=1 Tax=Asticcacaulis biprosthecium C19 TaxID=715226 RepID=F4QKA7_9CAUL|nr:glutathione S-transferase N-terminal domain-containing protein [Asticcacaulis biprosthecium]EGF93285.1 glutathione S-transferase, N-terminal domain protein [Asticcacaulis biprosthecium C19]
MKLFVNSGSPFARKVRIVLREKGLMPRVEECFTVPVDSPDDLVAANPLAQIPALIDDDGVGWTDSAVICHWLDGQGAGARLLPDGEAAWPVRRLEVLAAGILEMTVKMVLENRRPETERSPFWLKRWESNLVRGFAAAEAVCPSPDVFDLGSLTLGLAATYADFRYPHIDWRAVAPKVAALQAQLEKRQSFVDTYPK